MKASVTKRTVDEDGNPIGSGNNNLILDQRKYKIEFLDGIIQVVPANIIVENLLSQVDEKGHRQLLLTEIIDHRKDDTAIERRCILKHIIR